MDTMVDDFKKIYEKAVIDIENNKITEGLRALEKAKILYDKNIYHLNLMGLCYYLKCDFDKAIELWQKSLSLKDDEKTKAYIKKVNSEDFKELKGEYNKAIELLKLEKYGEAIVYFERVKILDKTLITPYKILYLLYNILNNKNQALINITKAMEYDSSDIEIINYYKSSIEEKLKIKNTIINILIFVIVFLIIIIILIF